MSNASNLPSPAESSAQTVTAAIAMLEAVSEHPSSTLSELARHTGNSLNRTFRLLTTLEQAGLVVKDRRKTYRLGAYLMLLGRRAQAQDPLIQASSPVMDQLAAETGHVISLAVRTGTSRIVVSHRAASYPTGFPTGMHDHLPLHWGAMGCCLLAFAPPEIQTAVLSEPLEAFTAQTITKPKTLARHLGQVREQRWDMALEEDLDIFSIAAPILEQNQAIGAIAIGGSLARLNESLKTVYRRQIQNAAEQISARLAGLPVD